MQMVLREPARQLLLIFRQFRDLMHHNILAWGEIPSVPEKECATPDRTFTRLETLGDEADDFAENEPQFDQSQKAVLPCQDKRAGEKFKQSR